MKKYSWILLGAAVFIVAVVAGAALGLIPGFGSSSNPSASHVGSAGVSPAGPGGTLENRLVIPSIGANAQVIPEGASGPGGGAFDVPSSVHVVGWWDGVWKSPTGIVDEQVPHPGDPGVAVLAGHIDSATQGHGALYGLQQIKNGADITVYDAKGKATHWKVTKLQVVNKSALPSSLFVNTGPAQLAIVSCGGPFNPMTGHYRDNVIALASPA